MTTFPLDKKQVPVATEDASRTRSAETAAPENASGEQSGSPKPTWGQRLERIVMNAATPLNKYAVSAGSEPFLPMTLDLECQKAARILRSFCQDGLYPEQPTPAEQQQSFVTIPSSVIASAYGLAIFTTGRVGCHWSGSTGSGVLVARLPDGSWSPPSGILVRAIGTGFTFGVDVYDCVCVINTPEALEIFTKTRFTLGTDLALAAGRYGAGGAIGFQGSFPDKKEEETLPQETVTEKKGDTEQQYPSEKDPLVPQVKPQPAKTETMMGPIYKSLKQPVYSYIRSRGLYAGFQAEGTAIVERKDANAAFYGASVSVDQILKGQVPMGDQSGPNGPWIVGATPLFETLKSAEKGGAVLPKFTAAVETEVPADDKLPLYVEDVKPHPEMEKKPDV